jgi:hypothetical protein
MLVIFRYDFNGFVNDACHQEVDIEFEKRGELNGGN